jgi:hypothetical protein
MTTKPASQPTIITGVTNADRTRLLHLIDELRQTLPEGDLSFLESLAGDLPRVKTMLPEPMRRLVTELDTAQSAFETAWATLLQQAGEVVTQADSPVNVRDRAALQGIARIANQVAQSAAEAALRAQALDSLIAQHYAE